MKFLSNYRIAQHLFNIWTFILIDWEQKVNKLAKWLRVTIWKFVSTIFLNRFHSFKYRLLIGHFFCHENIQNDTESPDVKRRVSFLKR
jgi:hypothetical protein